VFLNLRRPTHWSGVVVCGCPVVCPLSSYTAKVSGSAVFSTTFTRDNLGRITQKVETIGGVTDTYDYTYDPAGQLQQVNKNGACCRCTGMIVTAIG
jgi:hypothetical protein